MKILILANNDIGLYKFRKELIETLLSNNHEVYISLPKGQLVKNLEQKGCVFIDTAVDRRGLNPIKDIGLMQNYISACENFESRSAVGSENIGSGSC